VAICFVLLGCADPSEQPEDPALSATLDRNLKGRKVLIAPMQYPEEAEFEPDRAPTLRNDSDCFLSNARQLVSFYRKHQADAVLVPVTSPDSWMAALRQLRDQGAQFDRVVLVGHGTPNGPSFDGENGPQIGWDWPNRDDDYSPPNQAALVEYGGLLGAVTTEDGFIYMGACNSGSVTDFPGFKTYLDVIACASGRAAYGTASYTACWDVRRRLELLDGSSMMTNALRVVTRETIQRAPNAPLACRGR
jgi:hypothetical protein